MSIKELAYYTKYILELLILKRKKPLVAGVAMTDACNLQCKHCDVANAGLGNYSFDRIAYWIGTLYAKGARVLYLQGGEPFLWSENGRNLDDVIRFARKLGYFRTAVTSNGTFAIKSDSDVVWISIDGTREVHDSLRGARVYERAMGNIAASSHQKIYANMTVNSINYRDVEAVVKAVDANPKIRGISINFHTPYPRVKDLYLTRALRAEVIEKVIRLKRQGYPILNSISGLKVLRTGNYARPVWMVNLVERDKLFECCWGRDEKDVCQSCGYGFIAELSQILRLKPGAIFQALKIF